MYAILKKPKLILIFNKFEYHRQLVCYLDRLSYYTDMYCKEHRPTLEAQATLEGRVKRKEKILRGVLHILDEERRDIMEKRFFQNIHISQMACDGRSKSFFIHKIHTSIQDLCDYTMRERGGDYSIWQI